jgi:hypothetical protein
MHWKLTTRITRRPGGANPHLNGPSLEMEGVQWFESWAFPQISVQKYGSCSVSLGKQAKYEKEPTSRDASPHPQIQLAWTLNSLWKTGDDTKEIDAHSHHVFERFTYLDLLVRTQIWIKLASSSFHCHGQRECLLVETGTWICASGCRMCFIPPLIVGLQCICTTTRQTLFVLPPVNSSERTSDGFCEVDSLFTSQWCVSFHKSSSACNSVTLQLPPSVVKLMIWLWISYICSGTNSSQGRPRDSIRTKWIFWAFKTRTFSLSHRVPLSWCVFAPLTALHIPMPSYSADRDVSCIPVVVDLHSIRILTPTLRRRFDFLRPLHHLARVFHHFA